MFSHVLRAVPMFSGGNDSQNYAALLNQWFPPLPSCTDKGGNCQLALQPRDLLWNPNKHLISRLQQSNSTCSSAASTLLGKFTDTNTGSKLNAASLAAYLGDHVTFYNAVTSQAKMKWALCPEGHTRATCPGATQTVEQAIEDIDPQLQVPTTTAITVSPSHPLKSFWQPQFTPQRMHANGTPVFPLDEGFGVGIDPSNNGANIFNEAALFHEAIHGMSELYDNEIEQTLFGVAVGNPLRISINIKDKVLSSCPISTRPGQ